MPELFGRDLTDREIIRHRQKLEAIFLKICELQNGQQNDTDGNLENNQ